MTNRLSPAGSSSCSSSGADSGCSADASSKGNKKKKKTISSIFSSKKKPSVSDDEGCESESDKNLSAKIQASKEVSKVIGKSSSGGLLRTCSAGTYIRNARIEGLNESNFDPLMRPSTEFHSFRIFAATWNVGGRTPTPSLNLEDMLQVQSTSDIYVIGFQEIVPLNAGNVLVLEDNEPAAKWITLINQALNNPHHVNSFNPLPETSQGSAECKDGKSKLFQKPNLKVLSRNLRVDSSLVKTCNCYLYSSATDDLRSKTYHEPYLSLNAKDQIVDDYLSIANISSSTLPLSTTFQAKYRLVTCKQMVGIFLSVWVRSQLIPHIAHLRICTMGRGIMGRLGNKGYVHFQCGQRFAFLWLLEFGLKQIGVFNFLHFLFKVELQKVGILQGLSSTSLEPEVSSATTSLSFGTGGCISVSMTLHRTSFCFVCSHLASGEKEGDEMKRNADVAEILKSIQFPNMCKKSIRPAPEKIIDHDRILWFGDLNYRVSSSYEEAKALLGSNNWDTLLEKDQLIVERGAGRVFTGWKEGQIHFAPTYKYCRGSDTYTGETTKSKKKRRTPAWCDRILWHGEGIEQLSYSRWESRFSDHRPVCAVFSAKAEVQARGKGMMFRQGLSYLLARRQCLSQQQRFHEY